MEIAQINEARSELTKLPLLGPALWLFARDSQRRFTFVADLDWRLMPPLVLDQCRVFNRMDVPWGFCSWAFVSDDVQARLGSNVPIIAPHEWRSGPHAWLIDVVAPFGGANELARQALAEMGGAKTVKAWLPGEAGEAPRVVELSTNG